MKRIIVAVVCVVLLVCNINLSTAQTKKVNPLTTLKNKTSKWFKDEYVELNFKDPYSYKLMKCELRPITLKEWAEDSKRDLRYKLIGKDTLDRYSKYQVSKREVEYRKELYDNAVEKGDSSNIKYRQNDYLYEKSKLNELLKDFVKIKDLEKGIDSLVNNSNENDLNRVVNYMVYLDAYGKNGYGNLVLGKYYYTIDLNGKTVSEVKQFD